MSGHKDDAARLGHLLERGSAAILRVGVLLVLLMMVSGLLLNLLPLPGLPGAGMVLVAAGIWGLLLVPVVRLMFNLVLFIRLSEYSLAAVALGVLLTIAFVLAGSCII